MRICTESTPARGVPPEGSPAKDLLRTRGMMQKKSLKPLYHAQKKRAQKISLQRLTVCPSGALRSGVGLWEPPPPVPPPFSARVARPSGGGQGGWGFPAGPPADHNISPPSPPSLTHSRLPQPPQPLCSASNHRPSAPVQQSRVRSSCVRSIHEHTSFDTLTFIFYQQSPPVLAFHSPVPPTTSPPQRTLCAGSFVSHPFVSHAPSLHHTHTYTTIPTRSSLAPSLKPQPAGRAARKAIA